MSQKVNLTLPEDMREERLEVKTMREMNHLFGHWLRDRFQLYDVATIPALASRARAGIPMTAVDIEQLIHYQLQQLWTSLTDTEVGEDIPVDELANIFHRSLSMESLSIEESLSIASSADTAAAEAGGGLH